MIAAQSGNRIAYNQLLKDIYQSMKGFVARKVPQDAVEDVLQDILIRVHTYRDSYSSDRPFKPWVNSIARNVIIDFSQKRRRLLNVVTSDQIEELNSIGVGHFDVDQELALVLDQLPDEQRVAFQLTKIQGLSLHEGAKILGISVSAFKTRTARAITNFKLIMEQKNK